MQKLSFLGQEISMLLLPFSNMLLTKKSYCYCEHVPVRHCEADSEHEYLSMVAGIRWVVF